MDRSNTIVLIKQTYTTDSIGQRVATETYTPVFCQIRSVTSTEWFAGGQNGIKPAYQVSMFKYEYSGELIANIGGTLSSSSIVGGKRYSIYRTYEAKNDILELYLEEKAGTK